MFKVYRGIFFFIATLISATTFAQNFGGNPSNIHWQQINNAAAKVIFPTGLDSQASRIAHLIAHIDTSISSLGNKTRKWNVVLNNQTVISNAYVRLAPLVSEFYMTPPQNNFDQGSIRWDDNLVVHENRHMQQFSNFNKGLTIVFSFLLGQEGQLLANGIAIPDYFFEGDAVFQETLLTEQGRGRMPGFFNDYKSLWLAGKNYNWMKLRSGSYKDFTPDHYRTGYLLVAYGYEKYGNDFWKKVTADAVAFKGLFYPYNKAIQRHSGKRYRQFRTDALNYFKERSFEEDHTRENSLQFITPVERNNYVNYQFPVCIGKDSILVVKNSFRSLNTFCLLVNGKEKRIRITNSMIDNYYSYNGGRIVYASVQSDPRWGNRQYSVLQIVDIYSGKQKQLTHRTKYFSPDINKSATEIIAVEVKSDGTNQLVRIDAHTGKQKQAIINPYNYFFTQTKYIDDHSVIAAVRNSAGQMALVKVSLNENSSQIITHFTYNVLGYPCVQSDTVYFNMMIGNSDKIMSVQLSTKQINIVKRNDIGLYFPSISKNGDLYFSVFTADGYRLAKQSLADCALTNVPDETFSNITSLYVAGALQGKKYTAVTNITTPVLAASRYRKSFHLFNFHSWRPVIDDPEYGYSLFGNNLLNNFSSTLTYSFNRNEKSHTIGFSEVFAGWFPVLSVGAEASFNRNLDVVEAVTDSTYIIRPVNFNSAKLNPGLQIPLQFTGGRTNKFLTIGTSYNLEQLYYTGIGKNIFTNEPLRYSSSVLVFSNLSRQARQHVNPRWAQTISMSYRYAFNFRDSRKFVTNASLYFPGISPNHSIVLQGSFQKRDSLPDLFSNTFSYSRGYAALSTRRMYKFGLNYQFPVVYPDLGFGNIIFFQRIRVNAFYDYTSAHARVNGKLTNILNRSTGAEVFIDTKCWNELPVTFIIRYAHLLDTDRRYPSISNKWEFSIPIVIPD